MRKPPTERRAEIVAAATTLFARQGYAATTVEDILAAVGIAKGTFYHHFRAKDDVMREVVTALVHTGIAAAEDIAADRTAGAPERFARILLAQSATGDKHDLVESLHALGNAEFHLLSHVELIAGLTPVLARVVRDGVAAGDFTTGHPEEAVAIIVTAISFLTDDGFEQFQFDPEAMVMALVDGAERILGARPGALREVIQP